MGTRTKSTYSAGYVESNPTIDRFAETIEKLAEDIYVSAQEPFSMRHAFVHFGSPIDLSDYLESFKRKSRVAVHELTESCERSVQQGLDHLNANNPHPGARLWEGASV